MKRAYALVLSIAAAFFAGAVQAQPAPIPPNILAKENLPMVMLTASKDFTMFWKAYTDFEDIDFDGAIDFTFNARFKYYGYFDPVKCYTYDGSKFHPTRVLKLAKGDPSYCNGLDSDGVTHSSEWSGNFLNWATMSRIDVLRKVLYGGLRSTDTDTSTVLELSFVPRNSQAFVKYYNGSDLAKLVPYASTSLTKGITMCRRPDKNTNAYSHTNPSPFLPQIRVAFGNMLLWNMTEVRTCNWSGEQAYTWKDPTVAFIKKNYVTPAGTTGTAVPAYDHLVSVPAKDTGFEYIARVSACVKNLFGEESCQLYGSAATGNYKPKGLLHEFGVSTDSGQQPARAEFALMMGSYQHNLEAGILRKNMAELNDEINPSTGVFTSVPGIIRSLNEITLFDYNASTGNYRETCFSDTLASGSCPSWGNPVGELLVESLRYYAGKTAKKTIDATSGPDFDAGLSSVVWSDPMDPTKNPSINSGKLRNDLYGQPICRPMNMVTISGGVNSYDNIDPAKATNLLDSFTDITTTSTITGLTDKIGEKEGINGSKRLVGFLKDGATAAEKNLLCTAKTVTTLGQVEGACPDGPNFKGTYLGAGAAHFANTQRIRTATSVIGSKTAPADLPHTALSVRNYAVTMSGGLATIEVPLTADPKGPKAFITPAALDFLNTNATRPHLPGNMVDFKILSRSTDGKQGSALVLWQHSMLGEDQDQDMLGTIRWDFDSSTQKLKVWTQTLEADTGSSQPYAFGYTIVGTTGGAQDGVHYHSAINNYLTTETGVDTSLATEYSSSSSCAKKCVRIGSRYYVGETARTYDVTGVQDATIKEPLWYVAKYGGFAYEEKDGKASVPGVFYPTAPGQWDTKSIDGTTCSDPTKPCDGVPDNYFFARRPDLLEESLRSIFKDIVRSSNTSPAIASAQLRAGDLKFVAKFEIGDGHGEISAYDINATTGNFNTAEWWNAHSKLVPTRPVITNNGATGVPFQWDSLTTVKQDVLRSGISGDPGKVYALKLMDWLRGDTSNKSEFRTRDNSVLGPIVNSNPTVQGMPNGNYFGTNFDGYGAFVKKWIDAKRKPILWVGAGDGMLHAFDASIPKADGGKPIMSYIPDKVFARLPDWASPAKPKIQSFVDGSPFTGDVKVSSGWETYLFTPLGRGGKAIVALNVTDPAVLADETKASSIFKWQFSTDDDPNDLGYIITEPTTSRFSEQAGQIARMNNGQFAALFGNGVMSNSGNAVLYILFADGPSSGSWTGRYVKITAQVGPGNALFQPIWIDENNDGVADSIYAGDLKGQLWKFDVRSSDSTKWAVAYKGQPLFVAKDGAGNILPITAAPEFRFHPMGGVMLTVATGKAYETADFPDKTRTHHLFGIWDKPDFDAITDLTLLAAALPYDIKAQLQERTLHTFTSGERYIKGDPIDWAKKQGWYMAFLKPSEMSVSNLALANGQVIAVSVAPQLKASDADSDPCLPNVLAYLTAVDAMTGAPDPATALLGTKKVEEVDASGKTILVEYPIAAVGIQDQKVRISKDVIGTGTTAQQGTCANGTLNCSRIVGKETDKSLSSANVRARIFWREVPGLKTREVK